jgi:multiple antibiotic resistance protein
MFLALTGAMPDKERNHAALRASVVALGVIAVFAVFGRYILAYLHISVEAMQVSGGFLLLLVALQLLMGNETTPQAGNWDSVAIVPLATPLLAGPGAIVAMMLAVEDAQDVVQYVLVAVALLTAMVLVYLFLRFAGGIRRLLRESGTILASRIAGLLLSAIAVQMVANGVFGMIAAMS